MIIFDKALFACSYYIAQENAEQGNKHSFSPVFMRLMVYKLYLYVFLPVTWM